MGKTAKILAGCISGITAAVAAAIVNVIPQLNVAIIKNNGLNKLSQNISIV
jgi:hypothetical protein